MYEKPMILVSADMGEGVFTASGNDSDCYSVAAYIHQTPEIGRGDYRIQINAQHLADHGNDWQEITICFNMPVIYKSSGGVLISGDGGNIIKIQTSYHQNPQDNIGFGDLIVEAEPGLSITSVYISDAGHTW